MAELETCQFLEALGNRTFNWRILCLSN
jgi:hypothetical protein